MTVILERSETTESAAVQETAAGSWRVRPHTWRPSPGMLLGLRVAFIVGLIAVWEILVATGVLGRSAVAAPSTIVVALGELGVTPAFWEAIGVTIVTWAIGLGLSVVIAVPLGIAFGTASVAYTMFRNTIDFLRSIPPIALIPVALLLFGARVDTAVALIVFGSVWPLLLQTMYGVHQIDPVVRDTARSYRLTARWRLVALVLPSAAPFIATGFRIAATMSLLLAVGAQVIAGAPGIGRELDAAFEANEIGWVYSYILVAGILGMLINLGLLALERVVLSWHPSNR